MTNTHTLYPFNLISVINADIPNRKIINDYKKWARQKPINLHTLYIMPEHLAQQLRHEKEHLLPVLSFRYSRDNMLQHGLTRLKQEIARLHIELIRLHTETDIRADVAAKAIKKRLKTESDIINEIDYLIKQIYKLLPPLQRMPHFGDYTIIQLLKNCKKDLEEINDGLINFNHATMSITTEAFLPANTTKKVITKKEMYNTWHKIWLSRINSKKTDYIMSAKEYTKRKKEME